MMIVFIKKYKIKNMEKISTATDDDEERRHKSSDRQANEKKRDKLEN